MSALAELFDILHDRVPPKYILPVDEIVDLLRQHITQPMTDEQFHWAQVQDRDIAYDDERDSDLREPTEFYDQASEVSRVLEPYYTPPFKRGTYSLNDWNDEVYEFLSNSWNALYNDLHNSAGGARASQRLKERETHKQRADRRREEERQRRVEADRLRQERMAAGGGSSGARRMVLPSARSTSSR